MSGDPVDLIWFGTRIFDRLSRTMYKVEFSHGITRLYMMDIEGGREQILSGDYAKNLWVYLSENAKGPRPKRK